LVYSVILAGPGDLRSRRRIRIERDDGLIRLGECRGDGDCRPDMYGSFPIDAEQQVWWGIVHDGATSSIYFEFGTDGEVFSQPPQQTHVPNITRDMVECVGIELGTDETGSDTGISAFDDIANGRG
ncbi:MAG TPA: hypothetical protein VEL05_02870, partial [Candidatus Acidoferrum sp.]|nr:hypothetical protein [Candidatus Acidoferrum sp.]